MKHIDVNRIFPEQKDIMRAEGLMVLRGKTRDDDKPFRSNASKMSKLITDPYKMVRRSKAVSQMYGYGDYFPVAPGKTIDQATNVFAPFAEALEKMGFSKQQINDIAGWKLDPLVKERQAKMADIMKKIREQQTA
jgi:hypothetical protein